MIQLLDPNISAADLKRLVFDCNAYHLSPMFKLYLQSIPPAFQLAELHRLGVGIRSLTGESLNTQLPKDIWALYLGGQYSNKVFIDDRRGGWNRYIIYEGTGKSESEMIFGAVAALIMATGKFHGEPIDKS